MDTVQEYVKKSLILCEQLEFLAEMKFEPRLAFETFRCGIFKNSTPGYKRVLCLEVGPLSPNPIEGYLSKGIH